MSAEVIEVTRLEDLPAYDPPPCDMELRPFGEGNHCRKPSTVMIHRECTCGMVTDRFLCESCYAVLVRGGCACGRCWRIVKDWKVI